MILVFVIPGPSEPSQGEMNKILDPMVDQLLSLKAGIMMSAYGCDSKLRVHAQLHLSCSDLPASRKAGGFAGHVSEEFMCIVCEASTSSLLDPSCFHPEGKSACQSVVLTD
jgi:hypothetical protein